MPDTRRLLVSVGSELSDVARGIEDLAGLASALVHGCDPSDRGRILRDVQAADLLIQKCLALAAVVRGIGHGQSVDAVLSDVTLTDVADRLRGTIVPSSRPVATGDLVLFD